MTEQDILEFLKNLPLTENAMTSEGLRKNAAKFVARTNQLQPKYILDVGGNMGLYACAFAFLHPNSIIHSFEPHPKNFECLAANTQSFSNIYCHQVALWSQFSILTLRFPENRDEKNTGLFSVVLPGKNPIAVKAITLNKFCEDHNFIPNLIKIDAEGAEREILLGATNVFHLADCIITEKGKAEVADLLNPIFQCKYEDHDQYWFKNIYCLLSHP